MPKNFIVTNGSRIDYKKVTHVTENIDVKLFLAYCGYHANEILSYINNKQNI